MKDDNAKTVNSNNNSHHLLSQLEINKYVIQYNSNNKI